MTRRKSLRKEGTLIEYTGCLTSFHPQIFTQLCSDKILFLGELLTVFLSPFVMLTETYFKQIL